MILRIYKLENLKMKALKKYKNKNQIFNNKVIPKIIYK